MLCTWSESEGSAVRLLVQELFIGTGGLDEDQFWLGAVWFGVSFIEIVVSLAPQDGCLVLCGTWKLPTLGMLFLAAATGLCTYAAFRCKKRYDALRAQSGPCGAASQRGFAGSALDLVFNETKTRGGKEE